MKISTSVISKKMNKRLPSISLLLFWIFGFSLSTLAQITEEDQRKDSLYIQEIEDKHRTFKVLHAEPLYIDLIRDLGARKGEREWNIGTGLSDNTKYDSYIALVEYEWAPIDRLGLEVELPFNFYYAANGNAIDAPTNRLNSLKVAAQYTVLVHEKMKTSVAFGYIHEFELTAFKNYSKQAIYTGNIFNPFVIAAKRWGNNIHTLLYTGPAVTRHFQDNQSTVRWQINTNLHYMIPGTRNFIGIEVNKEINQGDFDMTIRPQMRVGLSDNLLVGIVTGIPVTRENERFSAFLRLIYEPPHHK
jgi:hypothetical protein